MVDPEAANNVECILGPTLGFVVHPNKNQSDHFP